MIGRVEKSAKRALRESDSQGVKRTPPHHLHLEVHVEAEPRRDLARMDEGRFHPRGPRIVVRAWAGGAVIPVVVGVGVHADIRPRAGGAISGRPKRHDDPR